MEPHSIDEVWKSLVTTDYGWRTKIPSGHGTFLGQQVALDVMTRGVPDDGPPPPPDSAEVALVRSILGALPDVLAECERQFTKYRNDYLPDITIKLHEPHIWINRDTIEDDGPSRWSFVVEESEDSDSGHHLEFDGLRFLRCWGGD